MLGYVEHVGVLNSNDALSIKVCFGSEFGFSFEFLATFNLLALKISTISVLCILSIGYVGRVWSFESAGCIRYVECIEYFGVNWAR